MKSRIFLMGVVLCISCPSAVMAQDDGCRRDGNGRIIGTVVGAGAGGVLGNVVAERGDKTEGAIIGAIVGAVIGNQVSKSDRGDCRNAYGFYDEQGRWHATGVRANEARGYYDRNGAWVDGQPNGYYDDGRWVVANGDRDSAGYTDRDGHWVPASSVGYYDRNNRWVGGTATGYYDTNGRWIAGSTRGRYDSRGRWIVGDTGYASENSANWNAVEQPGYYDSQGRWVAGRTYGYYDAKGRWISTRQSAYPNNDNRPDNPYRPANGQYDLGQMPKDISTRISWTREYIRNSVQSRQMDQASAQYARRELTAIEAQNRVFNRDGRFTQREEQVIQRRLDRLTTRFEQGAR
jgi:hypothetical protein